MYGQMYGQKVSPFYRTLSPTGAAAQKGNRKELGKASSDNTMDNPLALPEVEGLGRLSGENPLALPKGNGQGRLSSDNP